MKESLKNIVRDSVENLFFSNEDGFPVLDIEISIPKKKGVWRLFFKYSNGSDKNA